jgi:4-alpha-glucanotransferase
MSDLHAAAEAAGLRRDWEDADGRAQRVGGEVLEAILARLDTTAPETPFLTAEVGGPLPVSGAETLVLEDGRTLSATDGRAPDAVGYHRLEADGRTCMLAIAPPRCPAPPARAWGVAVQLPSLRGATPSAYGDLGTLAEAARAFGRAGAQALAISPTHALFPADAARFSPYAPSTRLFHNVLLADPALVGAPPAAEPAPDLIDWQNALPARLRHLRKAFDALPATLREEVGTFRAKRGQALERHARFDALHAQLGGNGWREWPAAFQRPGSEAVERFAAEHAQDVTFHVFLQWLADRSLAAAQGAAREHMTIGLVADLAVGMDSGGSHAWSRREELLTGLTIGAPPDPLGPLGQNWGITALDPFALARTGFRGFIETIRTALTHAGGIRIDHALGLDRLWVVPEGASAGEGAYLTMPGETLKRLLAIEAHRANAIVIAEDLGTVPPGFRDDLAKRGMLGMRVLQFERDADTFTPSRAWDTQAVAMTSTHDIPTLAGWWHGNDIAWSRRLGHIDAAAEAERRTTRTAERAALWQAVDGTGTPPDDAPIDTLLEATAAAPCPLALIPLEDVLGLEEQPNIPGTIDEHPNWRRRMPAATDALLARADVARRTALLSTERPG